MYLPLKKTTPPRTHSMALPLKELQKSFSNHRRSPFLLFTRHPDSRGLKVPMCVSGGCCCARAQKCSRRLGLVESSKVTQSSATTSQIHPHPSATLSPIGPSYARALRKLACFDRYCSALEQSLRQEVWEDCCGRKVVRDGIKYGSRGASDRQNQEKEG
jgi:hypothetical protein